MLGQPTTAIQLGLERTLSRSGGSRAQEESSSGGAKLTKGRRNYSKQNALGPPLPFSRTLDTNNWNLYCPRPPYMHLPLICVHAASS